MPPHVYECVHMCVPEFAHTHTCVCQQALRSFLLFTTPQCWGYRLEATPVSNVGSEDVNSGPYACRALSSLNSGVQFVKYFQVKHNAVYPAVP